MGSASCGCARYPIPFLPGPVSPPRGYILLDLQVELLFQLLFQ